jgi:hypothetical protein
VSASALQDRGVLGGDLGVGQSPQAACRGQSDSAHFLERLPGVDGSGGLATSSTSLITDVAISTGRPAYLAAASSGGSIL